MAETYMTDALAWQLEQLQAHAGRTVQYVVDAETTLTVIATPARKLLQVEDEFGEFQLVHADRDYLIAAALLVVGDAQIEPARGHTIIDANDPDGLTHTYEVAPAGPREPAWQWGDGYKRIRRVFTKLRSSEEA